VSSDNPVMARWRQLGGTAAGRWLFSRALGFAAPYTGTIRATVLELGNGRSRVALRDRRRVRNHLRSVHAIALMNLCEVAGGLLATVSMPADARMIITRLEIEFVKKARGRIVAEGRCELPIRRDHGELPVEVIARDADGDEVARATVTVLVGPRPAVA
jgi:acyl-coenzyme A thioesterase PaaI-like protein